MEKNLCKICQSETDFLFKSLVLNRHQADYFKCPNCDFIQTEKPFWLNEAYNNAITDLDIGLVSRNINFSNLVEKIIKNNFDYSGKFLDYAGGYGLFVRLMRDKGFNFYREDKYCENIFAQNYDLEDIRDKEGFEIVTAFEFFEHLENPLEEIEKMFRYSDTVIFSTDLQPDQEIKNGDDWWYFTPETGQHIAFYSEKTLQVIAQKFNLNYFSSDALHIFSKKFFDENPLTIDGEHENNIQIKSLIDSDFNFSKNILKQAKEIRKEIEDYPENNKENILIKKVSLLGAQLDSAKIELDLAKTMIASVKTELDSTKTELDSAKTESDSIKTALDSAKAELTNVYGSREWKTILKLQKIFNLVFPSNSSRRKVLVGSFRFAKIIVKTKRKASEIFMLSKNYLMRFEPKKKRKINLKSKKLVYIGHSYHKKTKSTVFLIDYLKEFFEVEVISDESWNGGPAPDLSFVDENYLGVIFFQLLPPREVIRNMKNDNIIYFPMYDQSGRLDYNYWNDYRDLKIINFSSTLHQKLKKWGFESMYVQYFPDLQKFIPGKGDEVFFWQRLTILGISKIIRLLNKEKVKIHIHKAIDPDQLFAVPSKEDENKFQIAYSDWFDTREEMWDVIKQKGIYIAPREYEGIGMSFLEAMAMGKAVIAVNNPTMNEYIQHGKNGYLFDLKNPKEIDLSNIEEVQKNTHKYMQEGYHKWNIDKKKIIEFIKK